jgi:Flp pilus assembly protein TadB
VAYGQTAANILAITPVIAVTLMSINVDGYSDFILNRPAGNAILSVSALMLAIGLVSVHRICRIESAQGVRAS